MHFKGLATSAVSRSSVFQINFRGLSKLVAVKPPAPECGRCADTLTLPGTYRRGLDLVVQSTIFLRQPKTTWHGFF